MATLSSILAWRLPWTEEPGRLQSMGSQRVRHDWATTLYTSLQISYLESTLKFESMFAKYNKKPKSISIQGHLLIVDLLHFIKCRTPKIHKEQKHLGKECFWTGRPLCENFLGYFTAHTAGFCVSAESITQGTSRLIIPLWYGGGLPWSSAHVVHSVLACVFSWPFDDCQLFLHHFAWQ